MTETAHPADTPELRREFVERFAPYATSAEVHPHMGSLEALVELASRYVDQFADVFGTRFDADGAQADIHRWLVVRGFVVPDHR